MISFPAIGRFKKEALEFQGFLFEDSKVVAFIDGKERIFDLAELKVLPPCKPEKIIGVGLNYRDHAEELGMPIPEEPLIFLKPPTAVIGHEDTILLPEESKEIHYEGELAIVIGRQIFYPKNFKEAEQAILGYTCFNDVTARDLQRKDGQWTRSKSFDTFAPLGPFIVRLPNPENLRIVTRLNGRVVQNSNTRELIFKPAELVYRIAKIMTLKPGDVIATGTPPGVGKLSVADVVEIEIEGIGILRNYVSKRSES